MRTLLLADDSVTTQRVIALTFAEPVFEYEEEDSYEHRGQRVSGAGGYG